MIEYCSAEIKCLNLLILCIYWNGRETDKFMESFINMLEILKKEKHKNIIIGGDFNIDMLSNKKIATEFKNILLTYNFVQQVKTPTRICKTTSTCIDLVFTNFSYSKSDVHEFGLSDHHGIIVTLETDHLFPTNRPRSLCKRFFTPRKIDAFRQSLNQINWVNILHEVNCINKNYELFHTKLITLLDTYFPSKTIKIKTNAQSTPRWMTHGIKLSCKHKRMLRILVNHTSSEVIKKHYRCYSKILKKSITCSKKKSVH